MPYSVLISDGLVVSGSSYLRLRQHFGRWRAWPNQVGRVRGAGVVEL